MQVDLYSEDMSDLPAHPGHSADLHLPRGTYHVIPIQAIRHMPIHENHTLYLHLRYLTSLKTADTNTLPTL